MKSIFGTANTPFGFCGFGYIDDDDLFKYLQERQNSDSDGLKDCKIEVPPALPAPLTKQQILIKVQKEIQNNQQLRIFLSRLPVEQQRNIVKNMIDSIMSLYQEGK